MAFPDDLTTEQILEWSAFTTNPPANEDERQERAKRQFRVYFLGTFEIRLDELGKNPATPESDAEYRKLRHRIEDARDLMLRPEYAFLVEEYGPWVERILDETRDLID